MIIDLPHILHGDAKEMVQCFLEHIQSLQASARKTTDAMFRLLSEQCDIPLTDAKFLAVGITADGLVVFDTRTHILSDGELISAPHLPPEPQADMPEDIIDYYKDATFYDGPELEAA